MQAYWSRLAAWLITQNILSFKTLASVNPPVQWNYEKVYIGFAVSCLASGIASLFIPLHTQIKDRLVNLFWTNAIVGGILYLFRSQGVPLLGMDLWRTLQLILFIGWVVIIIRFIRTDYKSERIEESVRSYKNKYLPKGNYR